jgi:hypothetical protein
MRWLHRKSDVDIKSCLANLHRLTDGDDVPSVMVLDQRTAAEPQPARWSRPLQDAAALGVAS